MKTNNLKSKYRILVVTGQTKHSQIALQNAVNLASKIDGSINLFYVKPPSQVANHDNQLTAFRELKKESAFAEKTMKEMMDIISATEKIPVTYNFTFGNVINEVQQQINSTQPDIVVLEKKKTNAMNLLGLDLVSYLLKNFKGALLISGKQPAISSQEDLALGMLDDFLSEDQNDLSDVLQKSTGKPITLLRINSSANRPIKQKSGSGTEVGSTLTNLNTFEFESGPNISSTISKYVEKSGVSLLCVRKSKLVDINKKLKAVTSEIQKTVQKTNTPVLIL